MAKRIVIVNAGERGSASAAKGDYDHYISALKRSFELADAEARRFNTGLDKIEVQILNPGEEVLINQDLTAVIFVSLSMRQRAETLKQQHPQINVVVLTGLLPLNEVVIAHKAWVRNDDMLRDIRYPVR